MNEKKVTAFSIGSLRKHVNKREMEEQKKKLDQVEASKVYEDFVAAFEDPNRHGKTFVRGTTFNAGTREEMESNDTGRLYKPISRFAKPDLQAKNEAAKKAEEERKALEDLSRMMGKKKTIEKKKKTNLEIFKEELKVIQTEREERHKMRQQMLTGDIFEDIEEALESKEAKKSRFEPLVDPVLKGLLLSDDAKLLQGSHDTGDPTTTNLYLGNISPKMTEVQLCEIFGKYGPLASVKVMWPRTDEEKARGRNCGFVAFMNRKDAERAMRNLSGKMYMEFEMRMGWGKGVPIPAHPVFVPQKLSELLLPPPPSGLPFNAQPHRIDKDKVRNGIDIPPNNPQQAAELDRILANAVVKVVVPTDRNVLVLIHRVIEFVVREGPLFEAMIMNRELNNPMYRFLFENHSPAHVYYRWKLMSILQGESVSKWSTNDFRMFGSGSIWRPPPINPYTEGMPEELIEDEDKPPRDREVNPYPNIKKGTLSNSQRDRLEDMLRNTSLQRGKIRDIMIYCVEHSEAADEICECIAESLSILHTALPKKIARLYLLSDILHNCTADVPNASYFRKGFHTQLPEVFDNLYNAHQAIESRLKAEQFKVKVMQVVRVWEEWQIYSNEFMLRLRNIFHGLVTSEQGRNDAIGFDEKPREGEDVDGIPLSGAADKDGDEDGEALDGAPLVDYKDDLDGIPIDDGEDVDGVPLDGSGKAKDAEPLPEKMFTTSKWETIDPNAPQILTKWDRFEHYKSDDDDEDDVDGKAISDDNSRSDSDSQEPETEQSKAAIEEMRSEVAEEKRAKLREIELKVMKYQDELESGKRSRRHGQSSAEQVEDYRNKLLHKELNRLQSLKSPPSSRKHSPVSHSSRSPHRSSRKRSRSRDRSASPAPVHKSKSNRSPVSSRSRRSPESRSGRRDASPVPLRSHRHRSPVSEKSSSSRRRSRSPAKSNQRRRATPPSPPPSSHSSRRRSRSPRGKTSRSSSSKTSSSKRSRH